MDLFGRKAQQKISELEETLKKQEALFGDSAAHWREQERTYQEKEQQYQDEIKKLEEKGTEAEKRAGEFEHRALDAEVMERARSGHISLLEIAKKTVEEEVSGLEDSVAKEREAAQFLSKQLNALQTEHSALQAEYSAFKPLGDAAMLQSRELSAANQRLSEENERYKKEAAAVKNKIPSLQGQIKLLEQEKERFSGAAKKYMQETDNLQREKKELKERMNHVMDKALEGIGLGRIIKACVISAREKGGVVNGHILDYNGVKVYVPSIDYGERLPPNTHLVCKLAGLEFHAYVIENPDVMLEIGKTVKITATRRDRRANQLYGGCLNGILRLDNTEKIDSYDGYAKVTSKWERPIRVGSMELAVYFGEPVIKR